MANATEQKWAGRWEQLKGRVKEIWGSLTDDELTRVEGDHDRLVGLIHERSGEAQEKIVERLRNCC